jgi:hypothetical protein
MPVPVVITVLMAPAWSPTQVTLQQLPGPTNVRLVISVLLHPQRISKSFALVAIDAQRAPPIRLRVKLVTTSRTQGSPSALTVQLDGIVTVWTEPSAKLVPKAFTASSTLNTPISTPVQQEHTVLQLASPCSRTRCNQEESTWGAQTAPTVITASTRASKP